MAIQQHRKRPDPPSYGDGLVLHGDDATIRRWLTHYWEKLNLPASELPLLAITQDRREYMAWTGKRLDPLALGCYCYLSFGSAHSPRASSALHTSSTKLKSTVGSPGDKDTITRNDMSQVQSRREHRHLIFIEPEMQPRSTEVTIAHELIHLADRVLGTPRRHQHHGYDSIADDEVAITGYAPEELRLLLREESARREQIRRMHRPLRYLYRCPNCGKHYPRARRYSHAVSCSSCDKHFNPHYQLLLVSE